MHHSQSAAPAGSGNFGFSDATGGAADESRQLTYVAAISEALREEMRRDPAVFLMGEDIAGDFGGAFKVTRGLEAEFGARRVINTPIAELGFVGAATGMALMGLPPEIMSSPAPPTRLSRPLSP